MFFVLQEAEIELAQDQPAANNPMYDPRFQDYVVNTTEASFHANPTFGAAPQRNLAPALRASEDRSMDVDMERDAGNMEEGGALLGAPIQAAAADWTALSTLRRMSAALVSAVSANAKRGSGQLAGEYDKAPTTQEPPDRDSSVFQRPLDGQGGWLPILGFQRKRTSESFLSGSDATSTLENLAVTFTAGSKSLIGAFGGRVGASGPAGDMGHFTVDRDWETLVDRKAEARAAEEELALDIDADTGEESPSRRDSGDLNFAVTDGFELEELPGRAHQLPITGQLSNYLKERVAISEQFDSVSAPETYTDEAQMTVASPAGKVQPQAHASSSQRIGGAEVACLNRLSTFGTNVSQILDLETAAAYTGIILCTIGHWSKCFPVLITAEADAEYFSCMAYSQALTFWKTARQSELPVKPAPLRC